MPVTLTATEKLHKKQRDQQRIIHNQILSKFSFKQLKSWKEVFHILGIEGDRNEEFTYQNLKTYLEEEKKQLEVRLSKPASSIPDGTLIKAPSSQAVAVIESLGEKPPILDTTAAPTIVDSHPTVEPKFELVPDEPVGLHDNKDYGWQPTKEQKAFLYWFQKKAAAEMEEKIVKKKYKGLLLLSTTGSGKTFMSAAVLSKLNFTNYHEDKTFSAIPYLYITKSTIVEQTERVLEKQFGLARGGDVEVINIEMLRSRAGQQWVTQKVRMEGGQEVVYWEWKKNIHPVVVLFDEAQGARRKGAKQAQIIYAYNDLPGEHCLVCVSASPFLRVSEAQAFAVSTQRNLDHLGIFPPGAKLNNENWPLYAATIAHPASPEEYNQAAVERLMEDLKDYVIRVRGIRPQYEAKNGVRVVNFRTAKDRKFYDDAWERFMKEKAKLDALKDSGEGGANAEACYLVILLKFAMAAEFCHARHFAEDAIECWKKGKAPVIAVKFKQTLIEIVRIWIEEFNISRSNISLIWGGGQTQQTDKQKAKQKVKELKEKFEKMGLSVDEMLGDMGLEDVEDRVIVNYPEHYRLGAQDKDDRQREIDSFQSGKTQFCIYTLKAGGVGLSLHHCDEQTKDWNRNHPDFQRWYEKISKLPVPEKGKAASENQQPAPGKVRRKESGYAVEEDIPFVPVRERETFVVVTYNAIELVQGVGRVPRLTSLSNTEQNVYCYAGTVEVDMGTIYSKKLRCLSSVVKMHEAWADVIMGGNNRQKLVEKAVETTANVATDESGTMIDESEGEEENGKE